MPGEIETEIQKLLEIKAGMPEVGKGEKIELLNQYIETELAAYKNYLNMLKDDKKPEWDELDRLFLKVLL